MGKLKWIDSQGGPLILVSDYGYKRWSGILKRSSYLHNKIEDADDFLNAEETDYGKACLVQDYLGVVKVGDEYALALGDEPLLTTFLNSGDGKPLIARWLYGEDENLVNNYLKTIDLTAIENWELSLTISLRSNKQYLFDSACSGSILDRGNLSLLILDIKEGNYQICSAIYEPDEKTKLLIHKFDTIN